MDVRSKAREDLCYHEKIGNATVLSVCCSTVMNSANCGKHEDDRISKGRAAEPFSYPWMVLLRNATGGFVCGGTLISPRYVLTAAHCTKYGSIVSVRLGENDISKDEDCIVRADERDCTPPPQDIVVDREIRHPGYSNRHKINDITLLRLEHSATLGDSVRTICLPNATLHERMVQPSSYIVSGWGLTENGTSFDVLRYAEVPSVSPENCSVSLRNLHSSFRMDESHICAGGVDQVDNCAGDSGGPLQYVADLSSQFVQQGIVSFGVRSCGVQSEPGVYTKVRNFISWIVEHVDE
ncbi:serine protease grass-like isoform X2 [Armigeres subalbatus]